MLCVVAEVPLDDLVKQYAGAYADGFEWPQPCSQSEDEDKEEADGVFTHLLIKAMKCKRIEINTDLQ